MKPLDNVCLFADTKAEWMISSQGCFKQGFPVVTLYTNLGDDAVKHGLCETEVETIITSSELLPKFKKILMGKSDKVKTIVYFENPIKHPQTTGFRDDVRLMSYWYIGNLSTH
jgi:long-chain acyl-CoA synthetase